MIIAVTCCKGGVGKTTISTHLAAASHLDDNRTLLIDTDFQENATDWFHIREEDSLLKDLVTTYEGGRELRRTKIMAMAAGYDVVVIDTPKMVGGEKFSHAAALAADVVVIPLTLSAFGSWSNNRTVAMLERVDETRADVGIPELKKVYVINRVDQRKRRAMKALPLLEEMISKAGVLGGVIHECTDIEYSGGYGECAMTFRPKGRAAGEMAMLWNKIKHLHSASNADLSICVNAA